MASAPPTAVWIVEDNTLLRTSLLGLIDGEPDLECVFAGVRCEEALAATRLRSPEIVLMDIGLPGMSGIEGVRELKRLHPEARIVMLTVHEDHERVFEAVCAGASGYLLKPSSGEEVLAAIRAVRQGAAPMNAFIAGRVLDLLAGRVPPRGDYGLSPREREILELLVEGSTLSQIAGRLGVSRHTVDTHVRHVYEKLHVHTRAAAVSKAVREALVPPPDRSSS